MYPLSLQYPALYNDEKRLYEVERSKGICNASIESLLFWVAYTYNRFCLQKQRTTARSGQKLMCTEEEIKKEEDNHYCHEQENW